MWSVREFSILLRFMQQLTQVWTGLNWGVVMVTPKGFREKTVANPDIRCNWTGKEAHVRVKTDDLCTMKKTWSHTRPPILGEVLSLSEIQDWQL